MSWCRSARLAGVAMRSSAVLSMLVVASAAVGEPAKPDEAKRIDYGRDVQPILAKACYSCHGPSKQKSGLRLDFKKDALAGGDLGKAIIPEKGADSPLVRYVAGLVPDM